MFGFNLGFDENLYMIEKKKQIFEEKAKSVIQKQKEDEIKKKKIKEKKDMIKIIETTSNNINKIQINFHNSFVNKQTHQTYDKIIENNNKIEYDNIINYNLNPLNSEIVSSTEKENEVIIMDSYYQLDNKTINEEMTIVDDSVYNITKTIKVDSDSEDYTKEDFSYADFKDINNDYLKLKEEFLENTDETKGDTNQEIKNKCENKEENIISNSILIDQLKILSENNIVKQERNDPSLENIAEDDKVDKFTTTDKENEAPIKKNVSILNTDLLKLKEIMNLLIKNEVKNNIDPKNNLSNSLNNNIQPVHEEKNKTKKTILNQVIDKTINKNEEIDYEIPEEIEINSDKYDFNKFLEESLNEKTGIQLKLRDEMKKIISNINNREKDKTELKKEKYSNILMNLNKNEILEGVSKSQINKDLEKNDGNDVLQNISILTHNNNPNTKTISNYSVITHNDPNTKTISNFTDSLHDKSISFPHLFNNKITFQNFINLNNEQLNDDNINQDRNDVIDHSKKTEEGIEDKFHQQHLDIINNFAKNYEVEIKANVENENYPINENYLKNNPEFNRKSLKKLSSIDDIIRENSEVENLLETNSDFEDINEEDQDFFSELNNGDTGDLFNENNIVFNQSIKMKELLNCIKKNPTNEDEKKYFNFEDEEKNINFENEEKNLIEEDEKKNHLMVFDNFKDSQEFRLKQKKFEEIRAKKIKEAYELKEKMNGLAKESSENTNKIIDKKPSDKLSKREMNYISSNNPIIPLTPTKKDNTSNIQKSNILKTKNDSKVSELIDFFSNSQDKSRTPVVIKRDESSKANKNIKQSLFKYNKLSNKNTIKSAITQILLAGEVNKLCRDKIIPIIDNCPCNNFIILFKGNTGRLDLKAIYTFDQKTNKIELLTCLKNSSITIDPSMIKHYYKYDIIQKEFKLIPETKQISLIVDAVMLH